MSDESIIFDDVEVRRGAGFASGGPAIDELSPGINVIFGPNASGKTTLAQAIRTLLWPKQPVLEEARLSGRLREGDANWRIEYADGRTSMQCNGADSADGPHLPSAEGSDRYYLSLQELLETDDDSFAAFILRESAGGYDVKAAREALDYTTPSKRRRKATRDVDSTRKEWKKAQREERELRKEERKLDELKRQLQEAERAQIRSEVLKLAIQYREAERERRRAADELEAFSDSMAEVRADDAGRLEDLRKRLEKAREERERAERAVEECETELARSPIPEEGLSGEIVPTLDEYLDQLERAEREESRLEDDLAEKESLRDDAREYVASGVDDVDEVVRVDASVIRQLETLARQAERLDGEQRAFEVLESLLGDARTNGEMEVLRSGIDVLRSWLSSPAPKKNAGVDRDVEFARAVAFVSAIGVGIGALVLLFLVVGLGFGLAIYLPLVLLAAALLLGWIYWLLRDGDANDGESDGRRNVYRRDYERLDLPAPEAWTDDGVERRLDELIRQWTELSVEAEKAQRWENYRDDQQEAVERRREIDEERRQLAETTGVAVDDDAAGMFWLVSKIHDWQTADNAVRALEEQLKEVRDRRADALAGANRILIDVGYGESTDVAEVAGRVDALKTDVDEFEAHQESLKRERENVDSAEQDLAGTQEEIAPIFERLGLEDGDDRLVSALCEQKEAYDEVVKRHAEAKTKADSRLSDLEKHPQFDSELLDKSLEALQSQLEQQSEIAGKRDEYQQEINTIETRIESAKKSVNLQRRRAEYESAREALRRERKDDYRQVIGAAIADYVEEQTRDRSRPRVFHRARELFSQITRGAYRLDLVDGEEGPQFRAVDTKRGVGLALDELSSGTRVQLLLAVRVAFVERQERGAMVPLVLDEVLANSDDVRAPKIIEAVEQIGAQGRQIFYFTAQRDEVQKWRHKLASSQVDWRVVELDSSAETPMATYGDEVAPPAVEPVPDPAGMSHREYGEALGLDVGLNPWKPVESVHLWYLVDDPNTLHRLLVDGIVRWGQLRSLADHGGLASVGLGDAEFAALKARAEVLDTLARLRAVGRGKAIDRRVLEKAEGESGNRAVTETFIDEVSALCDELDGDAEKLLEGLEDGRVKRFQSTKIEALREYFIAHDYLDMTEPLERDEIWIRLLAAVSTWIEGGVVDGAAVRAVIERATGGDWSGVAEATKTGAEKEN